MWFLEGTTEGGESTVVHSGDGRISSESFVHWNNREYRTLAETKLDDISAIRKATLVIKGSSWYRPDELYRAVSVRPFVDSDSLE